MSSEPTPRAACVVLVDDNATTRFLQRRLLGRMPGVGHVREAGSVEEALACLTQLQAAGADGGPVILIVDVHLDHAHVLLRQREWLRLFPQGHVVGTYVEPLRIPAGAVCLDSPLALYQIQSLLPGRSTWPA